MKAPAISKPAYFLATVLVLLAGLFMRTASLGEMTSTMLTVDEGWNGIDIMSVIQHPHFTPFFENNNGRESGWMYFQAPFVLVFGATLLLCVLRPSASPCSPWPQPRGWGASFSAGAGRF